MGLRRSIAVEHQMQPVAPAHCGSLRKRFERKLRSDERSWLIYRDAEETV